MEAEEPKNEDVIILKGDRLQTLKDDVEDPKTAKLKTFNKPQLMSYLNTYKFKGAVRADVKSSKSELLADAEYYQSQINDPNFV